MNEDEIALKVHRLLVSYFCPACDTRVVERSINPDVITIHYQCGFKHQFTLGVK